MHIGINGLFLRKPGSGIGEVTKHFLETLTEESFGHTYTVYVDDEKSGEKIEAQHLQYRIIRPWWRRDDLVRKLLWEYVQLPWAVQSDFVRHFLSLYQSPSIFTKKIQHIMVVHDMIPEIFPEYLANSRQRLLWKLTKEAIKKAQKIIAISDATKKDIQKFLLLPEERIEVIHPGISEQFFASEKKGNAYGIPKGYLYVGGGLEKRKNIEGLLRAYAEAEKNKTITVPLVISGFIHDEKNALATPVRSLIQELGLEEGKQVQVLGFVPDENLPGLYQDAALFVYPSLYEGFGLPVSESLALGTPVMAFRNSSLPEVGGSAVWWMDELTSKTLEEGLKKSVADTEVERERRQSQALQFRYTRFTQDVIKAVVQ